MALTAKSLMAALAIALALAACNAGGANTQEAAADPTLPDPVVVPDHVQAALADPGRAMHRGADERRRPGELVALSGLKAGDRVLDLIPGDGYWTRIFSRIVGGEGRVYAVWPKTMPTWRAAMSPPCARSPRRPPTAMSGSRCSRLRC